MAVDDTQGLVVWRFASQRYALCLDRVERVLPAIDVTPLPDAPEIVSGVVNFQGRLIAVVNMRRRLALAEREPRLADQLVLAHSARRRVAFFVDTVEGVVEHSREAVVQAQAIAPGLGCIAGVAKLADGLILIHDLDRLLSLDEERRLDEVLQ